jgi:hypothetical protein
MSAITACDETEIYYEDWEHRPGRHILARLAALRPSMRFAKVYKVLPVVDAVDGTSVEAHTEWRIACGI